MNTDFDSLLKENISKYCSSPGNSIDSLCSKMKTLSTCILVVKGFTIAIVTILLSRFFQNQVYSQMFLLTVAMWYLNKFTSIRDHMIEDIVRKMHVKIYQSSLQEKEDNNEDPEDVHNSLS